MSVAVRGEECGHAHDLWSRRTGPAAGAAGLEVNAAEVFFERGGPRRRTGALPVTALGAGDPRGTEPCARPSASGRRQARDVVRGPDTLGRELTPAVRATA